MLVPKKKVYRSQMHKPVVKNRKIISSLQMMCYQGNLPMICNEQCPIYKSCWFYGLKPIKE